MRTFHVIISWFSQYPCHTFSHFVFLNSCMTPCFSAYTDFSGSFDCWFNLYFCFFCLDAVAFKTVSQNKRLGLIHRNIQIYLPPLEKQTVTFFRSPDHEVWLRKHGWTWRGSSSCLPSLPQRLDCGHNSVDATESSEWEVTTVTLSGTVWAKKANGHFNYEASEMHWGLQQGGERFLICLLYLQLFVIS